MKKQWKVKMNSYMNASGTGCSFISIPSVYVANYDICFSSR